MFLSQQNFCRNEHNFVLLSQQAYFCRDKRVFVAIKHVFCHNKTCGNIHVFVTTNICRNKSSVATKIFCHSFVMSSILLSWQKTCFVATEMVLVVASTNDSLQHYTGRPVVAVSLATQLPCAFYFSFTLFAAPHWEISSGSELGHPLHVAITWGRGWDASWNVCICVSVCVSYCGLFTGRRRSPAPFVLASGSRFFALKCGWSPRWIKRSSFQFLA